MLDALELYVVPAVLYDDELIRIDIRAFLGGTSVVGDVVAVHTIEVSFTTLLANTESGDDAVEAFFNLVEQAVIDYLEAMPENASATFTII
jgi:hypothetical protein